MRFLRRGLPAALLMFGLAAPAMAQSQDPSFRVNNRTSVVINEIYVSSSNDNSWGQDRLGSEVLAPGRFLMIRLPQTQCINDIKIVFANGQAREQRRVDTCQLTDYDVR